jgi:hypothetical protein
MILLMLIPTLGTGCATPPTAPADVVLRIADGAVWLTTEEIGRFRCERGLLVCDSADGRVSLRRCRCLQ